MTQAFNVDASPDKWVAEDWRIALAWYCSDNPPREKDEIFQILQALAKEFTKRGDITFHPESYTKCAKEIATRTMASITDEGLYLMPPHGEMLSDGVKTAIVKDSPLKKPAEKFLYICSGKKCYGMARFKEPRPINLKEFSNLENRHRINEDEREKRWPNVKTLYFFELRDFFQFNAPKKIKEPKGEPTFIKGLDIKASDTWPESFPIEYLIASDVEVEGNDDLALVLKHARVHAKAEDGITEDVEAEHSKIVFEMRERGLQHRSTTLLDAHFDELKAHNFKIKFLGTKGDIEETNKNHKKHTGILIQAGHKKLLVDVGEPEFLKTEPDVILLTHFHPDHIKGLKGHAAELKGVPVYASPTSKCDACEALLKEGLEIKWDDSDSWDLFKFKAIPILHSKRAPAVAWKINLGNQVILVAPDILRMHNPEEVLRDVTVYVGDAATYKRDIKRKSKKDKGEYIGHASVANQMKWLNKWADKLEQAIFVQLGKQFVKKPKLEEIAEDEFGIKLASDGDVYSAEFSLIALEEVLPYFPERFSVGQKIFLVGSLAVNGLGRDIDLIERGIGDREAGIRLHQFLENFGERLSVHRSDTGPHNNYIPLYERVYERVADFPQLVSLDFKASDAFLALTQKAKAQAIKSRREDEIKPFRFFALQKTRAGYHKREVFTPEDALKMLDEDLMPYIGEEKVDGMHIEVHKIKDKVVLYSEDGNILSETQAKKLVDFLKGIKDDFIIVGELEMWLPKKVAIERGLATKETSSNALGYVHIGRSDTTGYIHSKKYDAALDGGLDIAVYDLLWLNGKDIHEETILDRWEKRSKVFPPESERFKKPAWALTHKMLNSGEDLIKFWDQMAKRAYSEGIMLKPTKESKYVLWYDGGNWIKLKSLYELTCKTFVKKEAKSSSGKKLGVYSYLCGIRGEKGFLPIGWTYNTKEDIKVGELLEVRFQQLNKYISKDGTVWYNWYRPTVVGPKPEASEADSQQIAERLVKATKGQTKNKEIPSDIAPHFGKLTASDIEGLWDELATELSSIDLVSIEKEPPLPKEFLNRVQRAKTLKADKVGASKLPFQFYVMQFHYRGKTVHIDFRYKVNGHLEGLTLLNQVEGAIKEPVMNWGDAKNYLSRYRKSPTTVSKFYPDMKPTERVLIKEKSSQPLDWATLVKESRPAGEPPIGTRNFPGFMQMFDQGLCVKTIDKPWFMELWCYGKDLNAKRLVVRLVPREKPEAAHSALQQGEDRLPTYSVLFISKENSPPYLFTRGFFEKNWTPPDSDSGLPPNWESAVPKDLIWWGKQLPRAKKMELIKAAFNYFVDEGFLRGRKFSLDKEELSLQSLKEKVKKRTVPFVLHRVWWRGPKVVRHLPVSSWHLRIAHKNELLDWVFKEDPTEEGQYAAVRKKVNYEPPGGESPLDWLKFTGELPPGHPENPNKKLVAHVTKIDGGKLSVITDTPDFFSFETKKSNELKGYYYFRRESPDSRFWLFERTDKVGVEG